MPRFEPFAGLRYDVDLAPLAEVIAPPYDVVDEVERDRLATRSPYNAIHVELPVEDAEQGLDRYANAAALFSAWEREGAIRRDDVASLYVYRMVFVSENGEQRSTTGVLGALGLDTVGDVLPHEQTMPKPKGDRLDLLRACRANLSPIWGLSLTDGLADACINATEQVVPYTARDDEGVLHELWEIVDPAAIEEICDLIESTPIVIADGHHRFETATFFRQEERAANNDAPGPHDLVMALVVELSPDELFVQSIHRLVAGLPDGYDLRESLAPFFRIETAPDDPAGVVKAMTKHGGIGMLTKQGNAVLVPLPAVLERAEADLDSSRLDVALADLPPHELTYQHGFGHVADAISSGNAQAAFLLRPANVAQIAETAHSGRRMPPKTTFFQPKPRTGMVFRSV